MFFEYTIWLKSYMRQGIIFWDAYERDLIEDYPWLKLIEVSAKLSWRCKLIEDHVEVLLETICGWLKIDLDYICMIKIYSSCENSLKYVFVWLKNAKFGLVIEDKVWIPAYDTVGSIG